MNYKNIYDNIVNNAKSRGLRKSLLKGYYELHHIVPRCLNGSEEQSNKVLLTAREHYICHVLLCKIYPNNDNLIYAWNMMRISNDNMKREINSKEYKSLKERFSKTVSKQLLGVKQPEETKLKRSKSMSGKTWKQKNIGSHGWTEERRIKQSKRFSGENNPNYGNHNKFTEEHKRNLSKSLSGKNNPMYGKDVSQETRDKISLANRGRKVSEETKRRLSIANSGRIVTLEVKRKTQLSKLKNYLDIIPDMINKEIWSNLERNNYRFLKWDRLIKMFGNENNFIESFNKRFNCNKILI